MPEISLTPQMVDRFLARFGDVIAVLHSKLSPGERFDSWQKIKSGDIKIVIGARSAIFAPIKNVGIIIIDEEHDYSYKSDTTPRYNAKDIARYIAKTNNVPLVLGSATPDINTFYKAKNTENIQLLTLSKRANNSNLPEVEVVDLKDELLNGNKSMFSDKLHKQIEQNLIDKRQTILFLNRRGFSSFVMCRECGYTLKCRNCNITLTYHLNENRLKCHYCGYETKNVDTCPSCKSKKIRYFGIGTEKLEEEIKKEFPTATTIRMDIDTVTKKNSHEIILEKFKKENIDILVGTQMIVKGHHFPNVTLVGVIAADASLNIEDYRANERTFQLLTQVAGRAGRENLPGKVIIQTYNPDNFSIEYAKEQDYDSFYNSEIILRQKLKFPPFCDIIMLNISSRKLDSTQLASEYIFKQLEIEAKKAKQYIQIFNPVAAPLSKIKNRFRWRIILKCNFNNSMIDLLNNVLDKHYNSKYNKDVRVILDVNPTSLM